MIISVAIKTRVMSDIRFVPKNYCYLLFSIHPFLLILVNFQALLWEFIFVAFYVVKKYLQKH
jgi:hypothetical protein